MSLRPLLRRVAEAVASLLVGSVLVWSLLLLVPGDPAERVLAARNVVHPTAAQVEAERAELGLDAPPPVRYARWLRGVLRGDLGTSWSSGRPVAEELAHRLPATARLTATALAMSLAAAVALALVAVRWPRRAPDRGVRAVFLVLTAVPGFLVATVLLDLVVVRWGHFRVVTDGTWATVGLPAVVLALGATASWGRLLRTGLLDAARAPHVEVAGARGASLDRRLVVHVLPRALVPFLTVAGVGTAALLGGAPVVETVFTWPGVGRYAVDAIGARDHPVIQGVTLLAVLTYVVLSTVVDLLAAAVDPRLRSDHRA